MQFFWARHSTCLLPSGQEGRPRAMVVGVKSSRSLCHGPARCSNVQGAISLEHNPIQPNLDQDRWRSFDVGKDEHPARQLLEELGPGLYDPIQTWLSDLEPTFPDPKNYNVPVAGQCFVNGPCLFHSRNVALEAPVHSEVDLAGADIVDVPVMAFKYLKPVDGFPLFHQRTFFSVALSLGVRSSKSRSSMVDLPRGVRWPSEVWWQ